MFREMRRKNQQMSFEECTAVLYRRTAGVLSLMGDNGYPYAVPLSYAYDGTQICFHSATTGHKIDAIKRCGKASFCVIDQDQIVPEKYTTYFRSVIVFGQVEIVNDAQEKRSLIEKLAIKYAPQDCPNRRTQTIDTEWNRLCVLKMSIEHISGKEAMALVRNKEQE
jgi:nitroimidazol reductase NimA-like FMN-containing flavoprotein (pyridoxamine 5'-phosphate oxidase superfamily)